MLEKLALNKNYKQLLDLYNYIPELQFWVKDRDSIFIWVNSGFLENYALQSESQVIGKTDFDLSPYYLAEQFVRDDLQVIEGKAIINRIELVGSIDQSVTWCMTNKRPVYDDNGNIVGSMGITRRINNELDTNIPLRQLSKAVAFIHQNMGSSIEIIQIARIMNCSISTLERKFKKFLHSSPLEFIRRIKIQAASKMLISSDASVTQVAYQLAYADQSHFIRDFKKLMQCTPYQYKLNYFNKIRDL